MSKIVKARGLPWAATAAEVVEFFNTSTVVGGEEGVHMVNTWEGRPSGTVYVEVESQDDVSAALSKDREKMGRRYVEVFESSQDEMDRDMKIGNKAKGGAGGVDEDGVVKCRGLPFDATKNGVAEFFSGLEIEDNGVLMTFDYQGRPKGECYVQFTTAESAVKALEKNKANMGHRYIEVFPSSMDEAKMAQQSMAFPGGPRGGMGGRQGGPMRGGGMGGMRPGPYDRMGGYGPPRGGGGYGGGGMRGGYGNGGGGYGGGGYGHGGGGYGGGGRSSGGCTIKMRGLPFRVSENEISEWFSSVADPVDIQIRYNHEGRPSGDAFVHFASEQDAKKAMQKDKQNMQHRYIELFLEG